MVWMGFNKGGNMNIEQKIEQVLSSIKSVEEKLDSGAHNELCLQEIYESLHFGLEAIKGIVTTDEVAPATLSEETKPEPAKEEIVAKVKKAKAKKTITKKKTVKKSKK